MSNSLYLLRLPKIQGVLETLATISPDDLGTIQKIISDGRLSARLHNFPKSFYDDNRKHMTYFYDLENTFNPLNIFYLPIMTFREMENPFYIEVSTEDYCPYFMGDVSIESFSDKKGHNVDDLLSNRYNIYNHESYIYKKILLHGKSDDGYGGLGSYAYQIGCILVNHHCLDEEEAEDLSAEQSVKGYDEFRLVPTFLGPWSILAFCGDMLTVAGYIPNDEGQRDSATAAWNNRMDYYKYFEMGLLGEALNQLADNSSSIPADIRAEIFASQLRGLKLFERYLICNDKERTQILLDIGDTLGTKKDMRYLVNNYKLDEINLKDCGFIKDIFENPAGTVDFCPNPDRTIR